MTELWDEIHGRLTAVIVKYPKAEPFIQSLRKNIRFALNNPAETRHDKLMKKSKQWLHEQAWKHPMFRDDFMGMVELIKRFEEEHGSRPDTSTG